MFSTFISTRTIVLHLYIYQDKCSPPSYVLGRMFSTFISIRTNVLHLYINLDECSPPLLILFPFTYQEVPGLKLISFIFDILEFLPRLFDPLSFHLLKKIPGLKLIFKKVKVNVSLFTIFSFPPLSTIILLMLFFVSVDIMFIIDILINFRTTYVNDQELRALFSTSFSNIK